MRLALASLASGLAACAPEAVEPVPPPEPEAVTHPENWAWGNLQADPIGEHQPETPDCPPSTWGEEGGRLEVQTGVCDFAWLVQPTLISLKAGDTISVASWHQGLDAGEPAEGHLALVLDGELLWELWASIPSPPEVFTDEVVVERDVPAGAEVGVHLHNHGFNSWSVGELMRTIPMESQADSG